jgi:hypothetical protein
MAAVGIFVLSWRGLVPVFADLVKMTYQFCLIVVIGGAVTWLFREYTRVREHRESDSQELASMSQDLVRTYNDIKRIRRLLRARAQRGGSVTESETTVRRRVYEELMGELNEVQLRLEQYKRRVRSEEPLFRKSEGLESALKEMEKYLHDIIEEYENVLRSYEEDPPNLSITRLPKLAEFIAPRMSSPDIYNGIFVPFRRALDSLAERQAELRKGN